MVDLPDARGLSPDELELLRRIAVHAVFDLGMSQKQAAEVVGASVTAVNHWCVAWRKQQDEAFKVQPQGRPEGTGRDLTPEQEEDLQQVIAETLPGDHDLPFSTWTRRSVGEFIRQKFGIKLSEQGVGNYLLRWKMTPQKPAKQAREQDSEEVEKFVDETLPDVINDAEEQDGELHFADETGVQVQDQIGTSYAPVGETPVLEFPKTRIAQNIISSVTADGDLIYWVYSGTMTAKRFVSYLELLIQTTSNKIFLFLDRHPAHTAHAVADWLAAHENQIKVTWLPRYSPEHNPDEFLNNDLKQTLKHQPLPETTSDFRNTIEQIMNHISTLPERIQGYFQQSKLNITTPQNMH